MDYGIPRSDHVNLGEGYNEWSYDSWGRPFDEQQTELLYSGAESGHTHRNSQSATVSCQAWGVHGDQQAVACAVGKETRATPAETHTTSPTPATLYPAAGRTVKSSSHAQPR